VAENKKSIIVYADWIHVFKELDDEEAGQLIKHFFSYVNDEDPIAPSKLIKIAFEPIKQTLKRDLESWNRFREKQSENGSKGGRPIKPKPLEENPKNPSLLEETQKTLSVSVNDSVNVSDSVNVNVNEKHKSLPTIKIDIVSRKLKFASTLEPFLDIYGRDFLNEFYAYWTEPNKSNTKFKQELEKTWDLTRRLDTWAKNEKNFKRNVAPKEKSEIRNDKNMEIMKQSMEILKQRDNGTIAITER